MVSFYEGDYCVCVCQVVPSIPVRLRRELCLNNVFLSLSKLRAKRSSSNLTKYEKSWKSNKENSDVYLKAILE